ncbi:MAG TPA: sigma-70 family RNA polymerase sigma factor [Fluviicola sp.]|nr:sigma-70 family RNA polymerase sigma factor [Fluviicola sp.]
MSVNYFQTPELLREEQRWVVEAKANPARFEPLYRKYYAGILKYLKSRIDDPEQAYDVASQVFVKALKNIDKFEDRGVPFGSWLYRIAKSELYQYFRDQKHEGSVSIEHVQISTTDIMFYDIQELESNRQLLMLSLQKLKTDQLKLIELRFFQQLSFKEIGELIGITENNAKVKTFRALERLKRCFSEKYAA